MAQIEESKFTPYLLLNSIWVFPIGHVLCRGGVRRRNTCQVNSATLAGNKHQFRTDAANHTGSHAGSCGQTSNVKKRVKFYSLFKIT